MADNQQQSFFIGETCFCIPKQHVSAIISAQDILPLATVPDYVLGTFAHQNQRVVAISVAMQMGLPQAEYHPEHKIIVIEHGDVSVGLLVDSIGDDFAQQHWQVMPYHSELFSNASVHSNEVVIQLQLDNLIAKLDLSLSEKIGSYQDQDFNLIQISGYTFAVPQAQIDFIVEPGKMTRIPMMPDYALGIFEDNQRTIQTISSAKKLGMNQEEHNQYHRVLVTQKKGEYFGFLVDAVNDQSQTRAQQMSPLPNLTRAGLLPGMMTLQNQEVAPILDLDVLYAAKPIKHSLMLDERLDYHVVEPEPLPEQVPEVPVEEVAGELPEQEEYLSAEDEARIEHAVEEAEEEVETPPAEEEVGIQLPHIETRPSTEVIVAAEDAGFTGETAEEKQRGFFQGEYQRRQGITRVREKSFWRRALPVLLLALLIIFGWLFINPSTESEMVRSRLVQYSSWLEQQWTAFWSTDKGVADKEEPAYGDAEGMRDDSLESIGSTELRVHPEAETSAQADQSKDGDNSQHIVEIDLPDKTITIEQRHKMTAPEPIREAKPGEIQHIVVKGDTLWDIAEKYLDDPFAYPELAELSKIRDPDLIYPGDVVIIREKN